MLRAFPRNAPFPIFRLLRSAAAMLAALLLAGFLSALPAAAQSLPTGPSGLPLPRFVSLKSGKVNLRVGPGTQYAVEWRYLKAGLPMEIIQEYDNWRRVRDAEGTEGWVHGSLLSGRRTAMAAPWLRGQPRKYVEMRRGPGAASGLAARIEPGALLTVEACDGSACLARAGGTEGYVSQKQIWGVYPGELFEQ